MAAGSGSRRGGPSYGSWDVPTPLPRAGGSAESLLFGRVVIAIIILGLLGLVLVATSTVRVGGIQTAVAPALQLSPGSGARGARVTVSGTSFPHSKLQLTWDASDAGMPSPQVNANGVFQATLTVPAAAPGTHTVAAVPTGNGNKSTGQGSPLATAVF